MVGEKIPPSSRIKNFLRIVGKRTSCETSKKISENPYDSKSGVDIKKLKGKKHEMYRLRIGEHRFEYFVEEGKIWIDEAFKRGSGYR